ncbi:MAG: hypothetical protein F8N37_03115 [Telmatospirillum sp.]|nr:hypothetical protein [Telmatospirillum sp.]
MVFVFRVVHLIAMASFVGGVLTHIAIGFCYEDLFSADSSVVTIKGVVMDYLITGGFIGAVISGLAMVLLPGRRLRLHQWLVAKIVLVCLIAANMFLVLRPIGRTVEHSILSATTESFWGEDATALGWYEDVFGLVNLLMILAVVTIGVGKIVGSGDPTFSPSRRKGR